MATSRRLVISTLRDAPHSNRPEEIRHDFYEPLTHG